MASVEPIVPLGGETLAVLIGVVVVGLAVFAALGEIALGFLLVFASWGTMTVQVFLRQGLGVRVVSIKNIVIGVIFLYFVGNMIGHNYHDLYRDRDSTIWGARVHFTFLVLFVVMAVYRRVDAWRLGKTIKAMDFGEPSTFAQFLPTHGQWAPRGGIYEQVLAEPLAVILIGLVFGIALRNWFGWYLVITGCLLFYVYVYSYCRRREKRLDDSDNPKPRGEEGTSAKARSTERPLPIGAIGKQ
jgi:hypothetical protein